MVARWGSTTPSQLPVVRYDDKQKQVLVEKFLQYTVAFPLLTVASTVYCSIFYFNKDNLNIILCPATSCEENKNIFPLLQPWYCAPCWWLVSIGWCGGGLANKHVYRRSHNGATMNWINRKWFNLSWQWQVRDVCQTRVVSPGRARCVDMWAFDCMPSMWQSNSFHSRIKVGTGLHLRSFIP